MPEDQTTSDILDGRIDLQLAEAFNLRPPQRSKLSRIIYPVAIVGGVPLAQEQVYKLRDFDTGGPPSACPTEPGFARTADAGFTDAANAVPQNLISAIPANLAFRFEIMMTTNQDSTAGQDAIDLHDGTIVVARWRLVAKVTNGRIRWLSPILSCHKELTLRYTSNSMSIGEIKMVSSCVYTVSEV